MVRFILNDHGFYISSKTTQCCAVFLMKRITNAISRSIHTNSFNLSKPRDE